MWHELRSVSFTQVSLSFFLIPSILGTFIVKMCSCEAPLPNNGLGVLRSRNGQLLFRIVCILLWPTLALFDRPPLSPRYWKVTCRCTPRRHGVASSGLQQCYFFLARRGRYILSQSLKKPFCILVSCTRLCSLRSTCAACALTSSRG